MGVISKGFLLFNTIKYLKFIQLVNRVRMRFRKKDKFWNYRRDGVQYREMNLEITGLDDNPVYIDRFKISYLVDNNLLTLLNETKLLDRWQFEDASHLWNFNVQYLEYLVPLYSKWKNTGEEKYRKKINEILDSWYDHGSREKDSNHPYTISLRVVNQLIIKDAANDKQKLFDSIYAQYRFLIRHQEKHLLGNHYLENLKAIVICSAVFSENDVYDKYIKLFLKEIEEQLTNDGLHFELSLMYHKIVLEDLLRAAVILKETQKNEYKEIIRHISKMCTALYSLEDGIKRTPLFNDAGDNIAKPSENLIRICEELFAETPEKKEVIAGYQVIHSDKMTLIMDCGELAPKYMPGHAHCDCLSFELFCDGKPLLVNSGTYQYQGDKRSYFRSTKAHNTVMINDHEQSELWGEHRAGRRIRNISCNRNGNTLKGEYENYLREKHTRIIKLEKSTFEVIDRTTGDGKSFLHLAPGFKYENGEVIGEGLKLTVQPLNAEIAKEKTPYSHSFGSIEEIECLVFSWKRDSEEHGYRIQLEEL